ncbi:rod shape-determining protein MreC [Cesiribacter andamanensis]|uniref:Cell shape-determining protein MreC n=1 Tax=Cesiribacter andamanensis AMV16 TaxID=1279009 RepID=M7NWX5_9BACT|nr:rod shape-determining protein MreC [Cesiribacter andamanensis]EMR02964.1 rod shape-determining protein MreC [Cesiribacter andamanensis AMV16]
MNILFQFLYTYRALVLFVVLELVCVWLIVQNNRYQSAAFFNSANTVAASVTQTSNEVSNYLYLKEANESLSEENARLQQELRQLQQQLSLPSMRAAVPAEVEQQYTFQAAQVINNSIHNSKNYITINKGMVDGIRPGMGVIGPNGVVGRIRSASDHFAVAISLLHTNMLVSAVVGDTDAFGSVKWNGRDPQIANLDYIARHQKVAEGDTIFTSTYNSIFPAGIPIGVVTEVSLSDNATYYDIKLDLATDFSSLSYVYVIRNRLKQERDSLESISIN